ncbi:Phototropic-responsive NPH3 family protein [Euphorbia peplus]|nr:Phototropic-responsive NPH3 family protein [Euphorbia peplus]
MKKFTYQEPNPFAGECWFDDACILNMDYFIKTLAGVKAKGVRPELVGSIISHYASKWLPELSGDHPAGITNFEESSPESVTSSWMKKRFFVETLVGVLPPEKDSIPCNFLLRLLRTANMVGAEPTYRIELEKRISWQLEQASLKELMIPSFSHTCRTVLDVELVTRLVRRFLSWEVEGGKSGVSGVIKVAKLVDSYLAEASLDSNMSLEEFDNLASVIPSHARATDDGLYRAIDTYLKAHPGTSKQERKMLCRLIDSRKLSPEASLHAAQNERLPVRAVIQVLFCEQTKLNRHIDWTASFSAARSPNLGFDPSPGPGRCQSKREMDAQEMELRQLREDVVRLQGQCNAMQMQMERMGDTTTNKKKKLGLFRWKKFGIMSGFKSSSVSVVEDGKQTPVNIKTKLVKGKSHPPKWRRSTVS